MAISSDVIIELAELFKSVVTETRTLLDYYQVSVYKSDTAQVIESKIKKMESLAKLFHSTAMSEAFLDYQALKERAVVYPGECGFTMRSSQLLSAIEVCAQDLIEAASQRRIELSFTKKDLRRRQREILALCPEGSRQWAFFQRL